MLHFCDIFPESKKKKTDKTMGYILLKGQDFTCILILF